MDYSTQPGKRKVPHSLPSEYGTVLNRIGNYFDHFLRFDYTKPAAVIEAPRGDRICITILSPCGDREDEKKYISAKSTKIKKKSALSEAFIG
jgi:hypothetical protein